MSGPVINTPRGVLYQDKNGRAELKWNTNFKGVWQKRYSKAQTFLDLEVLRNSEPYTPLLTGMLVMSGTLGTEPGSGLVQWIAPYAKAQYYSPRSPGSLTGPMRGPYWFKRMWAVSGKKIMQATTKLAGRG